MKGSDRRKFCSPGDGRMSILSHLLAILFTAICVGPFYIYSVALPRIQPHDAYLTSQASALESKRTPPDVEEKIDYNKDLTVSIPAKEQSLQGRDLLSGSDMKDVYVPAPDDLLDLLAELTGVYRDDPLPLRHPDVLQYGTNTHPDFDGPTNTVFKSSRPFNADTGDKYIVKKELLKDKNGNFPFAKKFENTVLMTFASGKHADLLYNWLCWVEQLNVKYFVFSNDAHLHNTLTEMGYSSYLTTEPQLSGAPRMSPEYWQMLFAKFRAVRTVLFEGFDVLYSDPDVVMLNDPFRFMVGDADLEYQPEILFFDKGVHGGVQINTGFVWYKANERTYDLFDSISMDIGKFDGHDDQWYTDRALGLAYKSSPGLAFRWPELGPQEYPAESGKLSKRAMNAVQFANGAIAHQTIRRQRYLDEIANGTYPVVQHFNFLKGGRMAKIQCMKQYNMWIYDGFSKDEVSGLTTLKCRANAFDGVNWSEHRGCKDLKY